MTTSQWRLALTMSGRPARLRAIGGALVVGAAIAASGSAVAQQDPAAVLANACTSCHGVDGRSRSAIPAIGGLPAEAIAAAMTAFADNSRPSTIMGRIARGYSAEQIQMLATFFSTR